MHLRPPAIAPGVAAFLWALVLSLIILFGMLAIGVEAATAFILSAVAAGAIFLFVRIYGEERPRRPAKPS